MAWRGAARNGGPAVRDVIEEIKRLAPASLKVTLSDGTEKPVAVPKAGNRWARTSQVLDSLRWVTVECLDAKGSLLGVIEADEPDDEDDVDDGGGDELRGLARILMDVQRATMKETRLMVDPVLRGMGESMRVMSETMSAQTEAYQTMMRMQQAYLMAPPTQDADGNQEFTNMMQMAMALRGLMPASPPKKEG